MEQYGVEYYHKLNDTKRSTHFKYTPLQGASVTSLWESADAGIEMDLEAQMKKNAGHPRDDVRRTSFSVVRPIGRFFLTRATAGTYILIIN